MPLSAAERVKWYCDKNKKKIRKTDNSRKKHQILAMKVNDPIKNMERLRKQRIVKSLHRQQKRKEKGQNLLISASSATCATIYSSFVSSAPSADSPT